MVSANNSKEHASVYHSVPETGIVGGVDGMNLTQQKQQMVEMGDVEHQQQRSEKSSPFLTNDFRATLISACYMSLAAMLGCLLRIACAQLFGEECKNPGTVGWLASDSPLCVTVDGGNSEIGGIVFADFPANMLGSFIMGLMLAGDKLLLPLNLPIPWLRADNSFQQWDVIHLAIRTGFCGSLTTFSSWNSDMVTMMFSQAGQSHSQVVRAIIGYIIGLETALGSFVFGSKVATMVHRYVNPVLAEEADAILERREQGVYINAKLPEFERRFLPDLTMNNIMHNMESLQQNPEALGNLERWRFSTREARRVGHDLLPALVEIENCILIERQSISSELEEIARNVGWNLAALDEWSRCRRIHAVMIGSSTWESDQGFTLKHAAAILFAVYVSLFLGLVLCNGDDSYSVTYRTMLYAAILAPPGALLRWRLSGWNNGSSKQRHLLGETWSWVPVGTLSANLMGSIISIAAITLEFRVTENGNNFGNFWAIGSMRAVKVGFAGCLTTVSTWVSEISTFMKSPLSPYRAYIYILMTLVPCAVGGATVYGCIVYEF